VTGPAALQEIFEAALDVLDVVVRERPREPEHQIVADDAGGVEHPVEVGDLAHSILGGSAWEAAVWRAVQRAGWDALHHAERHL
jgi:hypothetical protein